VKVTVQDLAVESPAIEFVHNYQFRLFEY